jgi:hypothetical protein
MAKYLAIFTDVIDEIEVNGFSVMTDKEVEDYEEMAESISWPFTFNFGQNEMEYSNGEELLDKMEFKELNPDEVKTFKRLFNNNFGSFVTLSYLTSVVAEESDDDTNNFNDDEDEDFEY